MRDREIVQRVKDATDLLAMVGQAVQLRRQGSAWVGRCPFHSERTPSFQVLPERGFYHCFGCGKHGDAFTWLMEREGLTFGEALEQLARAAGVELPRHRERPSAEVDRETRMRGVLEAAQEYYASRYQESAKARDYLTGRGISPGFAKEAGFGYAPDAWESLITHLRQQGYSSELVEQAGLASRNERGSTLDFLRDRLTIPIHDARGRLIAFGGRAFGDAKPKYLNTRETPLFSKGGVLFGFHRAKGQMRDGALVVEGYFDVLMLHQEGIHQAVAPLGTALTEEHLKLIARFTKRLVLCFDGDPAGLRAMSKSLKLALPLGFDVRLLLLPQGEDPDTWCAKIGAEGFKELLRNAPDWTSFVMSQARQNKDMKKAADRMEVFKAFITHFVYLPKTPENWYVLQSIAKELEIPNHEINVALKRQQESLSAADPELPPVEQHQDKIDELLRPLLILSGDPQIRAQIAALPHAWWETLDGATILQCVLDADGDDALLPPEVLAQLRHLEAVWASKDEAEKVPDRTFLKLEQAFVLREIQANNRMLMDPSVIPDATLARNLEQRQADLLRREKGIQRQLRAKRP